VGVDGVSELSFMIFVLIKITYINFIDEVNGYNKKSNDAEYKNSCEEQSIPH
jgi:hypothetical protein